MLYNSLAGFSWQAVDSIRTFNYFDDHFDNKSIQNNFTKHFRHFILTNFAFQKANRSECVGNYGDDFQEEIISGIQSGFD